MNDKIEIPEKEEEYQEDSERPQEYTQEAIKPIFTIAQDEVPTSEQVHVPTEEEQKVTLEGIYKKLGV